MVTGIDTDRRRFPRLEDPNVDGRLILRCQARLVDISLYGMGLEGEDSLQPKRRLRVTIPDGKRRLHFVGAGVWSHKVESAQSAPDGRDVYRGGLQFDSLPSPGTADLELSRFIALNAVDTRRGRKYKRYTLRPEVSVAEVEAHHDFEVVSISGSGMLVETDPMPDPRSPLLLNLRLPWVVLRSEVRLVRSESAFDDPSRPRSRLALEFLNLEEADRRQILGYVAEGLRRGPSGRGPIQ